VLLTPSASGRITGSRCGLGTPRPSIISKRHVKGIGEMAPHEAEARRLAIELESSAQKCQLLEDQLAAQKKELDDSVRTRDAAVKAERDLLVR
jgi:hypothetical protein